jgi:drug/metabolite transporter (DMT)-like permease
MRAYAHVQVLGGVAGASHHAHGKEAQNMLVGNVCLIINTLAMACYYVLGKQIVQKYHPIAVAAWAYLVGELPMPPSCTALRGALVHRPCALKHAP